MTTNLSHKKRPPKGFYFPIRTGLRRKVYLHPTNADLYHYAGNNPVRYIDPDGRDIDYTEDGLTITCDLRNKYEVEMAAVIFKSGEIDGTIISACATDSRTGNTITFNNSESMFAFVDSDNTYDGFLDFLARATSIAYSVSNFHDEMEISKLTESLSNVSTVFGAAVLLRDGYKAIEDPNLDTISDCVIDLIGFFGPGGATLSIGLTYGKKGVIEGTKGMVILEEECTKRIVNYYSNGILGIPIK